VSPEGGRLLAQGVSPGEKASHPLKSPAGAADCLSEREPWISAAPGGALKAFLLPLPRADALG